MNEFLMVTSTIPTEPTARAIADALIERRLAACVHLVGPIQSVYRWQGVVEHGEEWLLTAKTSAAMYPRLEAAILELHPYDCPELAATPLVEVAKVYRDWMEAQLTPSEG
jgi:periplasmic divalent cation tolerance protein